MKIKAFIKVVSLFICCAFVFNGIAFAETLSVATATAKISEDVTAKLVELSDKERISVYVYMSDDSDDIMETMASKHPEQYATYLNAKETDNAILTHAAETMVNEKTAASEQSIELQSAIETKRQLYRTHYSTKNEATLEKYCTPENFLYVSSYSPIAVVSVTASELKQMILNPSIKKIVLFEEKELSNSSTYRCNLNSRAKYVRDTYGNDGLGVKIGQIELAVPDVSDTYLASANIITNTSFGSSTVYAHMQHATRVAKIMVGLDGIVPAATLYSAGATSLLGVYQAIDWLVAQGVNVINMSACFYNDYGYDEFCAYVDHLAVQHDVHFVAASGNYDEDNCPNHYICSPGMAYNAITVGAYHDNGTAPTNDSQIYAKQKDDYLETYSRYLEGSPTGNVIEGPSKPNLVATGNDIWFDSGTSYAAPQVTSVIAQLCGYDSALKTKQSSMGAILAASCGRKLASEVIPGTEIVSSGSFKGGTFIDSACVALSTQISNTQGAGKLDAYWARTIVAADNYWSVTLVGSVDVYEKTVYITKGSETLTRVAIFWLKRNAVDDLYNITQIEMPDWDLQVLAPDGSHIDSSMTYESNFEIVQFEPPVSGNYKIQITRANSPYTEKSYIGIAVW